MRLAERLSYPGLEMRGHWAIGVSFFHQGEFTQAMSHFEKALALYEPEQQLNDAVPYSQNPGVAVQCFAARALWFLGQPDAALNRLTEALDLARELPEPHGLVPSLVIAAIFHQLCRNPQMAQEYAEAAIAVCSEHGLVPYQYMAKIMHAWSLLDQELTDGAIEQMRHGLADYQATGSVILCPYFLTVLGHALSRMGKFDEGLQFLEEGLQMAYRTGERSCEAELYRLKGEVLLMQSKTDGVSHPAGRLATASKSLVAQAESCFDQAITIAQQQGAISWELRAGISLAQLYQDCGKREEARVMLTGIYSKFTEGCDTKDSQEAKALIAELSEPGLVREMR